MFLTKGVGQHQEKLGSFEAALRKAGIAQFNLVTVSSIFPPHCKIVGKEEGLRQLQPGQILFSVMSRNATDEAHRLISASIGLARPKDPNEFGYLSEHHAHGLTDEAAGDYAEDLAVGMLASALGVKSFDVDSSWDDNSELWKVSDTIVRSRHITQSAVGKRGVWTTVVAAAVLIV
jgi:arginine decarboxylase